MNTLLPASIPIPADKLLAVIEIIIETAKAEKIFLLGYTTAENVTTDIFMPVVTRSQQPFACSLLVLVRKNLGRKPCNLEADIEKRCRPFLPLTVLIQTIETFIEKNKAGCFFTGIVLEQAAVLYNRSADTKINACCIDPVKVKKAAEFYFQQNLAKARAFREGAAVYITRQQNTMAAFMLHQATELGLLTLFKTITGFRVHTHNLEKLFRYCYSFSAGLHSIFPRNTEQEERLFLLLQRAYLDTRYTDTYHITSEELHLIAERIGNLHQVVEFVSRNWLDLLVIKKPAPATVF